MPKRLPRHGYSLAQTFELQHLVPSGPITDHRPSIRNAESLRIQQCSGWCRYTVANMVVPTTLDVALYSRYYTG